MWKYMLIIVFLLFIGASYYAEEKQTGQPSYLDLKAAWRSVHGRAGDFAEYDKPLLAFKVREARAGLIRA